MDCAFDLTRFVTTLVVRRSLGSSRERAAGRVDVKEVENSIFERPSWPATEIVPAKRDCS
jgi:hypothetical protein